MKNPSTVIVNLPCGAGGLNTNLNPFRIPRTNLTVAKNIRFDNLAINKAPGLFELQDGISSSGTCLGATSFYQSAAAEITVSAWSDGNVYRETADNFTATNLGAYGATNVPVVFVPFSNLAEAGTPGANRLAVFSAGTAPQQIVGTGTLSAFTAVSLDWAGANNPAGGFNHDFRLVAFGSAAYPHNLYFSQLSNLTDFTGVNAKVMSVFPGEGNGIVAGLSYLDTTCVVFKYPVGIYAVDTADLTALVNPCFRISNTLGACGPHAVVKVNGDIWFISDQGRIHTLSQVRSDIDPVLSDITNQLNLGEFIRRNVDLDPLKMRWARLHWDPIRQELIYTFTPRGQAINSAAIIIRVPPGEGLYLASIDTRGSYRALWGRRNTVSGRHEVLAANANGQVFEFNNESAYALGEPFDGRFAHPESDFADLDPRFATLEKQFKFLQIHLIPPNTASTLYVDIVVDGRTARTEVIYLGTGGLDIYGTALFGDGTFSILEPFKVMLPLDVTGRRIQLVCYNGQDNETFSILDMNLMFEVADTSYEDTQA